MIDPTKAEAAADFLRESAKDIGILYEQARMKESMVKHTEAILIKMQDNDSTPVTLRQAYARSQDRYLEAIMEDAQATGELKGLEARRDAAKTMVMLYMSQVKDRM